MKKGIQNVELAGGPITPPIHSNVVEEPTGRTVYYKLLDKPRELGYVANTLGE
jgi:hypothetical protein